MGIFDQGSYRLLGVFAVASLGIHVFSLHLLEETSLHERQQPVKMRVEIKPPKKEPVQPNPAEPEPEPEPPPPPPPQPEPKPKPKSRPPASKPQERPEPARTVSGLTEQSMVPKGSGGFQAPVGNTLAEAPPVVRDPGVVPSGGNGDRSRDAVVIASTVPKVEYTDEALDAEFEGRVTVDVFVSADGSVASAELRKTIGMGMDQRLLAAAKSARFKPRLNTQGIPESGWAELVFNLVIP